MFRLRFKVSALKVEREIDKSDHHWDFYERPDYSGEGGRCPDAEYSHRNGNR